MLTLEFPYQSVIKRFKNIFAKELLRRNVKGLSYDGRLFVSSLLIERHQVQVDGYSCQSMTPHANIIAASM